jgi:NAD-dependent dihydropyrimidine dehydrogenase PreA subunit
MGVFIRVEVLEAQLEAGLGRALAAMCPVDIFALEGDRLVVVPEREDECTLCELCLDAAPAGAIAIQKLYSDGRLASRGPRTVKDKP